MHKFFNKAFAALRSIASSKDRTEARRPRAIARCMAVVLSALVIPASHAAQDSSHDLRQFSPAPATISPLIDKVRIATAKYLDINVAMNEGWVQATPCVSGPSSGAMGVHFVLPTRLGDGTVNASEPEALIYEPLPNGALRLVGVEFIVMASDWSTLHPEGGAPSVDGHLMNYLGEPNRYGLPAFYELHAWAWENNPSGSFADWNTRVTCENQAAK
jgi:hypothetical protein